jgi:transcriptional regulator with XRE-family HTH domain
MILFRSSGHLNVMARKGKNPSRGNSILLEIGDNIRKWRHIKSFKQEALAAELGISTVALSNIEAGKTDLHLLRLYEIAAVLKIKPQSLFLDPWSFIPSE